MIKSIQISGNAKYGGATYLMLEWCHYLLERGLEVDVLSTDKKMIRELQKIPGLNIIDSIFIPREIRLAKDIQAFAQLVSLLSKRKPDVVHTYTETPSFIGRIAARSAGIPVIVNHQGGWPVNPYSPIYQKVLYTPLEYLASLASTKTICVSHAELELGRMLRIAPKRKMITIVNGINPKPFIKASQNKCGKEMRLKLGFSDESLLIGSTCRLVAGKGIDNLIQAMAILKNLVKNIDCKLLLAGKGEDQAELEYLVKFLGLEEDVHFLGFQKKIPALLAATDIFVLPTHSEGLSISLLEAMAAAKPIVATSIPANAEVIQHKLSGLLVPVKNPLSIAKAIATFYNKPNFSKQCSVAARKRVAEYYTLERMFHETFELYTGLLKQKRSQKYCYPVL